TFTLVPQVVAIAGNTPVLAAGGIGTGKHLAAALCLGAAGVWTGTLWLASRESDTSMVIKEKILAATEEDTTRSPALTGKPPARHSPGGRRGGGPRAARRRCPCRCRAS